MWTRCERRIDCKKRNILYENKCEICNPDQKDGKKVGLRGGRGIYVGETSRSLYERAKEHQADKEARSEDSHQVKHWVLDHPDLLAPLRFKIEIVRSFQDPLSRQLSEAVRIDLRGEGILNSKGEFNRCKVPRLTIDLEGWKKKKKLEESRKDQASTEVEEAPDEIPE